MSHLLFWLMLASGLTGKIQGTVQDETTGQPIPYADVVITNTEIGTATDDHGNFFIFNIPPGKYTLEISYLGYQTKKIENIMVEIDQAVRLNVSLKPSAIEMEPVVISGTTPSVKKDMVGSIYIIRKVDLEKQPIDYFEKMIALQPSVANVDTALHVRGGRATEVLYLIDNVSIIDPQTGNPAISIARGIIDEVIFMPGGFDAEYGRAMSGVVNLITEYPQDKLSGRLFGKTETIMPFYYDFGYQDYQASIHLPVNKRFKDLFAADLMHTDDWDPRLFILPHKQRDDYSVYSKWLYAPSGKLTMSLSAAKSRTQFDRYALNFKFNLDRYRSDLRIGDLEALNINYLPDTKKYFSLNLSRLYSDSKGGPREAGSSGPWENYDFIPYNSIRYPHGGYNNPYGAYFYRFRIEGHYPAYVNRTSQVYKALGAMQIQLGNNHELKAGLEAVYQDLKSFCYFLSNDTLAPILDTFNYFPGEYSIYVQDNIDYQGFYAKVGGRYDYYSSDIPGIPAKTAFSPRLGCTFMANERFLFRMNIGKYVQPPPYGYMYNFYRLQPWPSYLQYLFGGGFMSGETHIGNPKLGPEQTMCYEVGMQGEIKKGMNVTMNLFYKDISDLIGARMARAEDYYLYVTYFNVEYANVRGLETILEYSGSTIEGKISYSLSWALGTSSYANDVFQQYWETNPDTNYVPPQQEYNLDFDQRHRLFIQGTVRLPYRFNTDVFCFLGSGYPFTPPGTEGKTGERNMSRYTIRRQIDCMLSRTFRFNKISLTASAEILNILDARYQIGPVITVVPLETIKPGNFSGYVTITQGYYHPAADFNHDGLITPVEYYWATRDLISENSTWVEAYSSPRRARLGITVNF